MTPEILGIDLNAHRPDLDDADFDKLVSGGLGFVFCRLTRGLGYMDPTADRYLEMAEARGLVTGVYHYLEAPTEGVDLSVDGAAQAGNLLDELSWCDTAPDFLFLDVEESGNRWAQIVHFVERVRREGHRIGLYTSDRYWARYASKPDIFDYRWTASYTSDKRWLNDWRTPLAEEAERPDADIWQFTDAFRWGSPDGRESVDGNVAHFTTLKAMLRAAR